MKKYLRIFALILAVITAMMMVAACTANEDDNDDDDDEKTSAAEKDKTGSAKIKINETVLIDDDTLTITALEYLNEKDTDDTLKLRIENKSESDLYVQMDRAELNGYTVTPYLYESVTAGKKANSSVYMDNYSLKEAGIEKIGTIKLSFYTTNADGYTTLQKYEPVVLETNYAGKEDVNNTIGGETLYDENNLVIEAKYFEKDDYDQPYLFFYFENNTDELHTFSLENLSVNGCMINNYHVRYANAHSKAVYIVTIYQQELDENDIDKVEDIEFGFYMVNQENFESSINETFAISVK